MAAVVSLVIDDQSHVALGRSADHIDVDGTYIIPVSTAAALSLVAAAQALADRMADKDRLAAGQTDAAL